MKESNLPSLSATDLLRIMDLNHCLQVFNLLRLSQPTFLTTQPIRSLILQFTLYTVSPATTYGITSIKNCSKYLSLWTCNISLIRTRWQDGGCILALSPCYTMYAQCLIKIAYRFTLASSHWWWTYIANQFTRHHWPYK